MIFQLSFIPKENIMKIMARLSLLKRITPIVATLMIVLDATLLLWQGYERVIQVIT